MTTEIKFGGFGGQGVILAGIIIGRAASILDHKYATLTQSFGPEARGGACSAQVIISDEKILYPYVTHPEILVAMSQEACNRFMPEASDGATIIIEEDLVKPKGVKPDTKVFAIPATRFAEELGKKMILNIVMVGFFTAVTKLVSYKSVRETVKGSVPLGTETMNLMAFDRGYEYGQALG
ncbi:MAG: 2-oxoacid:acceptor oxidoreductase family protein [Acidobacteriota bacterium]|jgi:2-oxoglutarate ferredoxin oxidoreductase subunit gamma|nr:2-oxoacid:acceptor oxidoreductase family protein [Acidobacteriota bacterium]